MNVEKILTDNPYVDEMVYFVKILSYDCVIKSEKLALNSESEESLRESSLYLSCVNNTAVFELLDYTVELLMSCGIPETLAIACQADISLIPKDKKNLAFSKAKEVVINEYIEKNNYYRMLNGKPNYMTPGIKVIGWTPPEGVVIDLNKFINEMNELELEILDYYGIMDLVKEQNPTAEYLYHIGSKSVEPLISRQASNFQVLYLPNVESTDIYERFKEKLDNNKNYIKKTVYSDAFAYGSDYYDNFMIILIIITTMIDMFSDIQEFIAKKEILNLRCIQYIFKSYGIPYYPEIPVKYQIAMIKNINTLLKYKSTSRNMVDICSLFGFDNVEVFKYYILRERVLGDDGNYVFHYNDDGTEDVNKNYQLKFVRVPLEEEADNYIRDKSSYLSYDDVTMGDLMWDGSRDHNELKQAILEKEFNYARTKYVSIDNLYEVTQLAFQMPYFFNMIFDNIKVEELLTIQVSYLSNDHKFKMTDIFSYLYSLTYIFNDTEDEIMDTDDLDRVLYITGFNFSVDLAALGEEIAKQGITLKELGVADFIVPNTSLLSYNQLLEIFTKNGKIREHIIKQMMNSNNKKMYDIYRKLYNALMITKFTNDYFRNPSTGKICATYTEYLGFRDSILYQSINDIKGITDREQKVQIITTIINNVVNSLNQYIDTSTYKYIYSNLPSVSSESIKAYVVKVIDFFKSYKIDFLGMNTIYKFDDKLDNTVKIIDELKILYIYHKTELIKYFDHIHSQGNITLSDKISMIENIYFDISIWAKFDLSTDIGNTIKEVLFGMYVKLLKEDGVEIDDSIIIRFTSIYTTHSTIIDLMYSMLVNMKYIDKCEVDDYINLMNAIVTKSTIFKLEDKSSSLVSTVYKTINEVEDKLAGIMLEAYKQDITYFKSCLSDLISVYEKMDYCNIVKENIFMSNTNDFMVIARVIDEMIYKANFLYNETIINTDTKSMIINNKKKTIVDLKEKISNLSSFSMNTNSYNDNTYELTANNSYNDIFTLLDKMYYNYIPSNSEGYVLQYSDNDINITTTAVCSINMIGFNKTAFNLATPKISIDDVEKIFNIYGVISNIPADSVIKIINTIPILDSEFLICFRIDY